MTRKEILLLAAIIAKEEDNIIALAEEIADFLMMDEIEEEEPAPKNNTPKKPESLSEIKDPVKNRMWNMPEDLNVPPREAEERMREIMGKIGKADKSEFYVDPQKAPTGWSVEWKTVSVPRTPMVLYARETKSKKPRKSPTPPKIIPPNHRNHWSDEDKIKTAEMVEKAETEEELNRIAVEIGRTERALREAIFKGVLPLDPSKLNKNAFPNWKKVPYPKDNSQ